MNNLQNDKIFNIQDVLFYLPNYPTDLISTAIVQSNNFWDTHALTIIDKYINDGAVILDIGANVGNHTLYWAIKRNARKVMAFEPYKETFNILNQNIALNNLHNVVRAYNYGLSNESCTASIKEFHASNVGGTCFKKDSAGTYMFLPLDMMNITTKIDLIKIDAEWHEMEVLEGALETIKRNKPVLVIESFNKKTEIDNLLLPLGYELKEEIQKGADYLYQYVGEDV